MNIDIKTLQQELKDQSQSTTMFFRPGIHESVKLIDAIIKDTPSGVKVIQMTFIQDEKKLYYTEWLDEEKTEDAKKKVMMSILQVLNAIVPPTILDSMVITESLVDFAEKSILVLNGFRSTVDLRLKAVYVKDKVTVPLHSKFPWIENMALVATADSKIQMYPRDRMTPDAA